MNFVKKIAEFIKSKNFYENFSKIFKLHKLYQNLKNLSSFSKNFHKKFLKNVSKIS